MPEIEVWFINYVCFWPCTCTWVTVGVLKSSYCAFDVKLYVSAVIPVFRVHGCKTFPNSKEKQMVE